MTSLKIKTGYSQRNIEQGRMVPKLFEDSSSLLNARNFFQFFSCLGILIELQFTMFELFEVG